MINNLDIVDRILLAALIASLQDEKQIFSQRELLASDFSPTEDLSIRSIDRLINSDLIKIKSNSKIKGITYELNQPNNEEILKCLINSLKFNDEESHENIIMLIFNVLAAECIEYIVSEMNKINIPINSDSKPPQKLFELLSNHSSAEVHMLLWQVLKKLTKSDLRILKATENHSDIIEQIIDEAYSIYLTYRHFNRAANSFSRRTDYKISAIHKILFNKHLGCGLEYFTELRL